MIVFSRRRLKPRSKPVGTTKSARRRFSASDICCPIIASKRAAVIPGRRITRWRWSIAGADKTMT
jgi:hypothetical protein